MPRTKEWMEKIGEKTRFSSGESAAVNGAKGGKKTAQNRKEMKLWRDVILERLQADDMKEVVDRLIINAATNGGRDFEILRDTMGQKPTDKVEVKAEMTIEELLSQEGNGPEL